MNGLFFPVRIGSACLDGGLTREQLHRKSEKQLIHLRVYNRFTAKVGKNLVNGRHPVRFYVHYFSVRLAKNLKKMRATPSWLEEVHPSVLSRLLGLLGKTVDTPGATQTIPLGDGAITFEDGYCTYCTLDTASTQWTIRQDQAPDDLYSNPSFRYTDKKNLYTTVRGVFPQLQVAKSDLDDEPKFRMFVQNPGPPNAKGRLHVYISYTTEAGTDHAAVADLVGGTIVSGDTVMTYNSVQTKYPFDDQSVASTMSFYSFNWARKIWWNESNNGKKRSKRKGVDLNEVLPASQRRKTA